MNRFKGVEWFLVNKDGIARAFHEAFVPLTPYDFSLEISNIKEVTEEAPLDWIAFQELDDARKWKIIGEINWPDTEEPLEMTNATMLYVPPVEETSL